MHQSEIKVIVCIVLLVLLMYSCSKDQRPNSCDKSHRTLPPIPQCDIINSTLIYLMCSSVISVIANVIF